MRYLFFLGLIIRTFFRFRTDGRRLIRRIIIEQIYFTGVQAIELITLFSLFTGALLVLYAIDELSYLGNLEALNEIVLTTLVRQAGPMIAAIIVILRSGSALAIEMGYMNVLGEVEGIEMQGIPPMHLIAVPRLIGVSVAVMCLVIYADAVALVSGSLTGWLIKGVTPFHFYYSLSVAARKGDFLMVIVKGLCFGSVIPVICLYNGLQAQKAVTEIPPQVSRAVVDSLLYCVIVNVLISVAFSYQVFGD